MKYNLLNIKGLKEYLNESLSDKDIIQYFCSNNEEDQMNAINTFEKLLNDHNAIKYDYKNRDDVETYINNGDYSCFIQFNNDGKGCPFIICTKISGKYHIAYIKKLGDDPIYHKPNFWNATMRYFGYGDIYLVPKELDNICNKVIREIYLK